MYAYSTSAHIGFTIDRILNLNSDLAWPCTKAIRRTVLGAISTGNVYHFVRQINEMRDYGRNSVSWAATVSYWLGTKGELDDGTMQALRYQGSLVLGMPTP